VKTVSGKVVRHS